MNILGREVMLRAVEEKDLVALHEWSNDPKTQDIIGDIHFPSSFEFHKDWFSKLKDDKLNQRFAIEAIETPKMGIIGLSTIMHIDWKNNHALHGIMLGPTAQGKGYGGDAVITTMRYAFDELHMERLNGSMIEYNTKSIRFYEKLGWKHEGLRRNYYFRKGRYWNQVLVGITNLEYQEFVTKKGYWDERL